VESGIEEDDVEADEVIISQKKRKKVRVFPIKIKFY